MDAFNRGIYSPAQVDQLVADAKDANANVLVVQVGRRCDCLCNDALYPRTDAFIDPAHPDAVDYVVNLDYIRYPDYNSANLPERLGYSQTSLRRLAEETGRSDVPSADDEEFSQWRRDQVSALVRQIYLTMYQRDSSDRLSVNGITYAVGPQTYGGWENTRPYAEVMQARAAVSAGVAGWNGYSYANPSMTATASTDPAVKDAERDRLAQSLTESLFSEPAAVPEMDWKTELTTGHLAGRVVDRDGTPLDQASVTVLCQHGGGLAGTARTDGSGWFGVVDLMPGRYRVRVTEAGVTGPRIGFVTVSTGEVATLEIRTRNGG